MKYIRPKKIHHRIQNADLHKYEFVTDRSQLKEGMILIDKHAHKRTILSITDTEIWLSHKYGKKSKATGKSWRIETFMSFKNWIWKN